MYLISAQRKIVVSESRISVLRKYGNSSCGSLSDALGRPAVRYVNWAVWLVELIRTFIYCSTQRARNAIGTSRYGLNPLFLSGCEVN